MSRTARLIRVAASVVIVASLAALAWMFATDDRVNTAAAQRPSGPEAEATPATVETPTPAPTPTPLPTATPLPTPTPVPTPIAFVDAVPIAGLTDVLTSPLPACRLFRPDIHVAGTVALGCIEQLEVTNVVASADGRVAHISTQAAVELEPGTEAAPGTWAWADQQALGPHVVVDHGPQGEATNVQTLYAGLAAIDPGLSVGSLVTTGTTLGTIEGPSLVLKYSIWVDGRRQDGAEVVASEPPPVEVQRAAAEALAPVLGSPTDPLCPLVRGASQLPGAPRGYRNGTHRGIDFGCGAADRSGFAVADGTVVYLVDDYVDPSVADREALLSLAGRAGFTPHWTLVMLYGNVVVIDHGEVPGAGRLVTIAAHLEQVDPAISLGGQVEQGQRLGELGNRGTNASALGIRGNADPSLHLHWELFVDNWYLGQGLGAGMVIELVTTALCGEVPTPGCPA